MSRFFALFAFVLFLVCSLAPGNSLAQGGAGQGFAGLGASAEGFAKPERGKSLHFPTDHFAHPNYRIEWWYITANLTGPDGTAYGVQWTLFRSALAPDTNGTDAEGWKTKQLWMGHAALTTPSAHFAAERRARGGVGQAGVLREVDQSTPNAETEFFAYIDDWFLRGDASWQNLTLHGAGSDFSYDLALQAEGPLVLHGDAGYSVKSAAGQASYYYSQPFFSAKGVLHLPGGPVEVTGSAWLDREWSSQPLAADQSGWDWFSMSFDSGEKLMGFSLRSASEKPFTSGTWITSEGTAIPLPKGSFEAQPLKHSKIEANKANSSRLPTTWQVKLAQQGLDVTVTALNPQSWMNLSVPYWEGPVEISGSHSGHGYLEMTGY